MSDNEPLDAVAETVGARLDELGWKQARLAELAEIDPNTVSALLRGQRRSYRPTRQAMSKALGWPEDLLDRVNAGQLPEQVRPVPDAPLVEEGLPGTIRSARGRARLSRKQVAGELSSRLARPVSAMDVKRWEYGVARVPEDARAELLRTLDLPIDEEVEVAAENAATEDLVEQIQDVRREIADLTALVRKALEGRE